jgi:hypothetical protein
MKPLALIFAFSFQTAALAATKAIDPEVTHVESGGAWRTGRSSGQYRAVVRTRCSPEHCYDTLSIDWITEGSTPRVIATKKVEEVGDLTSVLEVKLVPSKSGTRLQVAHELADGAERSTKCLDLGKPGKYSLKNGPCENAG